MDEGLKKAVAECPEFRGNGGKNSGAGTISALAGHLGITRGAICQWSRVPSDRLVEVARVTRVSRKVLRPDLYRGIAV